MQSFIQQIVSNSTRRRALPWVRRTEASEGQVSEPAGKELTLSGTQSPGADGAAVKRTPTLGLQAREEVRGCTAKQTAMQRHDVHFSNTEAEMLDIPDKFSFSSCLALTT